MNYAILSSCFGVVIQRALSESSLFLLYAVSMGAGKFISLVTTSVIPLMTLFTLIPFAYIMEKTGLKRFLLPSYGIGMVGMLAAAAAGFFPGGSLYLFSGGIIIYAVSISSHSAGWFSLQHFIVPDHERGAYFGRLRYTWQLVVIAYLLLSALLVHEDADVFRLQMIITAGALLILGRMFFTSRIPERRPRVKVPPLRVMLYSVLSNKRLLHYSVLVLLINFLTASTVPLGFAFLKFEQAAADNLLVLFSVFTNIATVSGFVIASKVIDRRSIRSLFFLVQVIFFSVNSAFLLFQDQSVFSIVGVVFLICLASSAYAFCSVVISAKMMGLVKANNINLSLAFSFGLASGGTGLSRFISSLMLEFSPAFVPFFGISLSVYHLLFLCFGAGILILLSFHRVSTSLIG